MTDTPRVSDERRYIMTGSRILDTQTCEYVDPDHVMELLNLYGLHLRDTRTELAAALEEVAKWKRIRTPTHGSCCTCQACGEYHDDCRCDLDDLADKNERLEADLQDAVNNRLAAEASELEMKKEMERLNERIDWFKERHIYRTESLDRHSDKVKQLRKEVERLKASIRSLQSMRICIDCACCCAHFDALGRALGGEADVIEGRE